MRVYIAGPMRGIELHNFPAFDAAQKLGENMGYEMWSPAEMDRDVGFTATDPVTNQFLRGAMSRDLPVVCGCDAVALLPGWQSSKRANIEAALAEMLGLQLLDATTFKPYHETILDEAKRITRGDRALDYGHPLDECGRIAALWSIVLKVPVAAEDVPLCMIAMKMSREMNRPKRDNYVDMAGYADCLHRIHHERARRAASET